MTSGIDERRVEVNRDLLVGGAVLMSVGAVIGMAGALATSVAVIQAARSWVGQLDEPPSVIARRRLAQARPPPTRGRRAGGSTPRGCRRRPPTPTRWADPR